VTVLEEIVGRTLVVTIARPERRNAVDASTAAELVAVFERYNVDPRCDVAILTGAKGTFCAGADLQALARGEVPRLRADGHAPMGPTRMLLLKPVIAAVEGYAVGGGFELALWCDLRVAASNATFGFLNRRFGVPLVDMGTIRLPHLIGHSRAMDLILTGRPVGAGEAERFGIVNLLAPPGGALDVALDLAAQISAVPQEALRNDRLSAIEQWSLERGAAIANELEHGRQTMAAIDVAQAAARFAAGVGRRGEPI
jgi:enoyl-CoA hydratase